MNDGPVDLGVGGLQNAELVGRGGFAVVYRAFQPAFRRLVAVKILNTGDLDEAGRRRFERECHAMGLLSGHPGIVTVHDGGFTVSNRPYLVMAFVPGGTLADQLRSQGPMAWTTVVQIGVRLAGALETAHRAGIIHRDVKPANVLMSGYGALLSDFGIATVRGATETKSGMITASFEHAAPEVLDGSRPSVASDVYSLGSTMFAALAGAAAFTRADEESILPLVVRVQRDPVPDLRGRGVPEPLQRVVETAMAKLPGDRYPSALKLGEALRDAQRSLGEAPTDLVVDSDVSRLAASAGATSVIGTVPPVPPPESGATVATPPSAGTAPIERRPADVPAAVKVSSSDAVADPEPTIRRRGRWLVVAALALLAIALGAGMAYVASSRGDQDSGNTSGREPATNDAVTTGEPPTTESSASATTAPTTVAPPDPPTTATTAAATIPTITLPPTTIGTLAPPPPAPLPNPYPVVDSVTASTVRPGSTDACGDPTSYEPFQVSDGLTDTAWMAPGDGAGQSVTLYLTGASEVRELSLLPGYDKFDPCSNRDRFFDLRRITEVQWAFDDGSTVTHAIAPDPAPVFSTVRLSRPVVTSTITMTIVSTTPPGVTGLDHTPVSEIVLG